MPETATRTTVAADGVEVAVDLHGAGLAALTAGGTRVTAPGAVLLLGEDRGRVVPLVGAGTDWRVLDDSAPATTTLVADTGLPVTPTVTATVGSFGLAIVHGVTNTSAAPVRVGLAVRLHPDAGADATCALCGDGPPAHLDVVGADTGVVPGHPVAGTPLELEVGGGRPLPGLTHVVHRLRGPDGAERLRVWGDAGFVGVGARVGDGSVDLELRTVAPGATAADLHEIAPGETWMISWGLQPSGFSGPSAGGDA